MTNVSYTQSKEVSFSRLFYVSLLLHKIPYPSVFTPSIVQVLDVLSGRLTSGSLFIPTLSSDFRQTSVLKEKNSPPVRKRQFWKLTNLPRMGVTPPNRLNEFQTTKLTIRVDFFMEIPLQIGLQLVYRPMVTDLFNRIF